MAQRQVERDEESAPEIHAAPVPQAEGHHGRNKSLVIIAIILLFTVGGSSSTFSIIRLIGVPVVLPSKVPDRILIASGSCRCVVKRDCPGRRRSR